MHYTLHITMCCSAPACQAHLLLHAYTGIMLTQARTPVPCIRLVTSLVPDPVHRPPFYSLFPSLKNRAQNSCTVLVWHGPITWHNSCFVFRSAPYMDQMCRLRIGPYLCTYWHRRDCPLYGHNWWHQKRINTIMVQDGSGTDGERVVNRWNSDAGHFQL